MRLLSGRPETSAVPTTLPRVELCVCKRFGRSLDGYLLGLLADLERAVQLRRLGDVQIHRANLGGFEAGGGEAHMIGTWRQQAEFICSIGAGCRGARQAGVVAGDGYGNVGNRRAGLIGYVPG